MIKMTLLRLIDIKVVASRQVFSTNSSTFVDDPYASISFKLYKPRTVLIIYQSTNDHGNPMSQYGYGSAINIDGNDVAKSYTSAYGYPTAARNISFWVGTLDKGEHIVKGRIREGSGVGHTVSVSNRVLLVAIFDGDEYYYTDDPTLFTTNSYYFVDDPYASVTMTPSAKCKALIMYNATTPREPTYFTRGKKVAINVNGTDYTQTEKTAFSDAKADSAFTAYVLSLSPTSYTFKGRVASVVSGNDTRVDVRQFAVLLLDDSTIADVIYNTTQISTTSTTFSDDPYAVINRTLTDRRILLAIAVGTKRHGTYSSEAGERYGISIDGQIVTYSADSNYSLSYANSEPSAYAMYVDPGAHTVKGVYSANVDGQSAVIDARVLLALWFVPLHYQLVGYTVDQDGNPIPNCNVYLYSSNTYDLIATTTSDENGYFEFTDLVDDGPFFLRAYKSGNPNLVGATPRYIYAGGSVTIYLYPVETPITTVRLRPYIGVVPPPPPPPPPPPQYMGANQFPMIYLLKPETAKDLVSKVENVNVKHVANDFPEYLIRLGKASEFMSKIIGKLIINWLTFHHDRKRTGRTFGKNVILVGSHDNYVYALYSDGSVKWKYQTGFWVDSSPSITDDGTIYIGSDDHYLYALNTDGSFKWRYQALDWVASSPTVAGDGTIYVGSDDYYLYAINPNGTRKWAYRTGDWVRSSPAIADDGTIYIGSVDHYVYAINPDGTLKWRYQTGDWVFSSPSIADDGTIYIGSVDSYLYALNPDGSLKWRYDTNGYVNSTPAIADDGTIYVGSLDFYVYAFYPDGTLKWKYGTGYEIGSSPAIADDGTIYIGSDDDYVYAINPNGTLKWRYQTGNDVESSPAVAGDGTIYVGSYDYYLYAINRYGILKWRYQTGDEIDSSPAVF